MSSSDSEDELVAAIEFMNYSQLYNLQWAFPSSRQRIPRNNSILQGRDWVGELLTSESEVRFYDAVRMSRPVFEALVDKLGPMMPQCAQTRVPVKEALVIFLRTVGMHVRHRDSQERFQHSNETISRQFHRVLDAIISIRREYIFAPNFDWVHPRVENDTRMYPYFKDAVGAMDGTLIHASVPSNRQNAWRSRKGTIAQNVLAICDYDMMFKYVYAGWEGSATDSHVLQHAILHDPEFPMPPVGSRKYYLVDDGYSNYSQFLAPYRSTRYHLQEYNAARLQPQTPQELFNYRHSQLRNHIERAFGLLKSRFAVLRYGMPRYSITTQADIAIACCVLHNFIRSLGLPDHLFDGTSTEYQDDPYLMSHRQTPTPASVEAQAYFRDELATAMWEARGAN